MSKVLQDFSASALMTAIEANLFELWKTRSRWPQMELHDDPAMLWGITNIPFPLFNRILRAQLAPDQVDAAIEAAISRCKRRGVPMLWSTGPATRPANLGTHLQVHGFSHEEGELGMAVDLLALNEKPTPPGLTIDRVGDVETLKTWSRVLTTGFGLPDFVADAVLDLLTSLGFDAHLPIHKYLGRWQGEAVATSTLFLGAGVAGVYGVATLPEARRQGIGAAMTLAPLREARALGYRIGILQATPLGASVHRHQVNNKGN